MAIFFQLISYKIYLLVFISYKSYYEQKNMRNYSFKNIRTSHDMENAEDYLEIVSDLIQKNGEARIVDIANKLQIAQSTANKTIKRLVNSGYLYKEPYRSVFLTIKGQKLALNSKKRHPNSLKFFKETWSQ